MPTAARGTAALISALVCAACHGEPTAPGTPASLTVAGGSVTAQVAPPRARAPIALAVLVRDDRGAPVPNVEVEFTVTRGGGTIDGPLAKTDANGVARSGPWTLGIEQGSNEVMASLEGAPSLTFGAYGINLPTGAEAFDLVSLNGRAIPETGPSRFSPTVAERLVLDADSTYTWTTVRYDGSEWSVGQSRAAYSRSGPQVTLAGYYVPSAAGLIGMDVLTMDFAIDWGEDTAPSQLRAVYRRMARQ